MSLILFVEIDLIGGQKKNIQGEECLDCPDELFTELMDPLMDKMEKEHLDTGKQVVAGICAMAKKSNSKPMREILARLDEFDYIKTIIFPEETILKVYIHSIFYIFPSNQFVLIIRNRLTSGQCAIV